MQLTQDLATGPLDQLRILDLGCGEGVYAIEAGLRGADVLAIDARDERMREGAECAARHGLRNVRFERGDARELSAERAGSFDIVYCLGLLYHLDAPEVFPFLAAVRELCAGALIVDTLISLEPDTEVTYLDRAYRGERTREHGDDDPPAVRRQRLLRSIDSTFAFRFTRESLVRALRDAGFPSVLECHAPPEPGKAADRITLAAAGAEPVRISTYPWLEGIGEREIVRRLTSD